MTTIWVNEVWIRNNAGDQNIQNFPTSEGIYPMVHCENAASKLFASFMELVLRNSKTLETIVVQFRSTPLALECFAQLLQMPPTLPHNNNVSIVLNPSNYSLIASVLSLIWIYSSYLNFKWNLVVCFLGCSLSYYVTCVCNFNAQIFLGFLWICVTLIKKYLHNWTVHFSIFIPCSLYT